MASEPEMTTRDRRFGAICYGDETVGDDGVAEMFREEFGFFGKVEEERFWSARLTKDDWARGMAGVIGGEGVRRTLHVTEDREAEFPRVLTFDEVDGQVE